MTTIIVWLLAVLFLCVVFTLLKARRAHVAILEVKDLVSKILEETSAAFSQQQWLALLTDQLGLSKPLPPTRGWASSPDFLMQLAQHLEGVKPRVVIECSSGVSTLVIARSMQQSGVGHVYSLEHDAVYAERTRQMLLDYGVADHATVLHAPLVDRSGHTPWYDTSGLPGDLLPAAVLVVDGPPMATAHLARYPALPLLLDRLSNSFSVFVDDANRADERETVRRWQQEIPGLTVDFPHCEKGLAVIHRSA